MEEKQQFTQPSPQQPIIGGSSAGRSKKVVVILIGLALIVGIGVAVVLMKDKDNTAKQTTSSEPSVEQQEVANVQITANGFVPATIQVKAGTQVKWTNNDTAQHRVISDPHLKHDMLPELDSQEPLDPNDTFGFTFDKAGTYTYHDEQNPSKAGGTVIVE